MFCHRGTKTQRSDGFGFGNPNQNNEAWALRLCASVAKNRIEIIAAGSSAFAKPKADKSKQPYP
jgi:hypothetical protein